MVTELGSDQWAFPKCKDIIADYVLGASLLEKV